MVYIHIWILIFIFLPESILCAVLCGDERTVNGAVGRDVILPVNQDGIKDISWVIVNGGVHFATTKPDGDIDIRDNRYEGRLYGMADGSLHFTKLTREDQGEYTAIIRTDPGNKQCEQQYDLRVFSILCVGCVKSCGDKRTVIGAVGEDAVLPVNKTRIKDGSWVTVNGGIHFATTKPGGDIDIRDNRYEGRLYGTADGSLHFTKLTREDQGEYRATIRTDTGNKPCDQQYDLRVFNLKTMSTPGKDLLYGVFIAKGFSLLIVGLFLTINLLLTRKQGT